MMSRANRECSYATLFACMMTAAQLWPVPTPSDILVVTS
jgi:hypothetical protein